jgi:hypothetical protein
MAVSRAERRTEREPRFLSVFGAELTPRALDLLEIVELAWHDCYREVSPSETLVDDMLLLSEGSIEGLVAAAYLALQDWRDLKMAAAAQRASV